jgi:universal stress protein E
LVIIDPTAAHQPALVRAQELALAFGSRLELFACHVTPASNGLHVDEVRLEELARGTRELGIETTTDAASHPVLHTGILRKVLQARPSLVVKDTHPHTLLRRSVIANTDWQLIRLSPAPILFVRPGAWGEPPRIAAAVDVAFPGEKPVALDHELLACAETFSLATHAQLHAVHAYLPISSIAATATTVGVPLAAGVRAAQIIIDGETFAQERFDQLLSTHHVAQEQRHLLLGRPAEALVEFVRRSAIDLLVMGAFARGWMYNVFVGSTTERILDLLPCDVLVMKPASFECPLS